MKTEQISASIVNSYKKLSSMAEVNMQPAGKNYLPTWHLRYKHNRINGYVCQLGFVERGKTKIIIRNEKINKVKKPFFLSWKKTLTKIDNMLKDMIKQFNNKQSNGKKVVQQGQINILCFPKGALDC